MLSRVVAAGALLRDARHRAGLSQAELGRRAGVTQSVISAYESGTRQPSVPTLARLIKATGSDLDLRISAPAPARLGGRRLASLVREQRDQLVELLDRYGLANPRLFGSVARGDEHADSDIDLLVDVPSGVGLLTLARAQADVEQLLGVPVDLVPSADLKRSVADDVLAYAVPL